jgi:hypothetical protein
MKPGPQADLALVEHMRDAIARIRAYTGQDAAVFHASKLVQDGVIRNLQTLAESSQRLSDAIKATEAQIAVARARRIPQRAGACVPRRRSEGRLERAGVRPAGLGGGPRTHA